MMIIYYLMWLCLTSNTSFLTKKSILWMKKNSRDAQMRRIVMRSTSFIYKESGRVSGIIFQYNKR